MLGGRINAVAIVVVRQHQNAGSVPPFRIFGSVRVTRCACRQGSRAPNLDPYFEPEYLTLPVLDYS